MTESPLDRIKGMLDRVAKVTMPSAIRRGRGEPLAPLPTRERIEQLEFYLLLTAEARQLAESARLAANDALFDWRREWDGIEGWEMYLNGSTKNATGAQIDAAKTRVKPFLAVKIAHADYLVKRLSEQIRRLEHDDEVASRVYTLITGG